MKNLRRWCVKSREGWCAARRNKKPSDAAFSVETRCGYSITLPHGTAERVPTCPDCVRLLLPGTDWAKRFKAAASPSLYKEALSFAEKSPFVHVFRTDETGDLLWAVTVLNTEFWLDAFPSAKEAWQLVRSMGWTYSWEICAPHDLSDPVTESDVVACLASEEWELNNRSAGWWLTSKGKPYRGSVSLPVTGSVMETLIGEKILTVEIPYTSAHAYLIETP